MLFDNFLSNISQQGLVYHFTGSSKSLPFIHSTPHVLIPFTEIFGFITFFRKIKSSFYFVRINATFCGFTGLNPDIFHNPNLFENIVS